MRRLPLGLLALFLASCWAGKFATIAELTAVQKDLDEEKQQRATLEEVVGQLGCPEPVRETLKNLQKACEQYAQAEEAGVNSPTCDENAAEQAINRYSKKNAKSRYFLDLLTLRHVASYVGEGAQSVDTLRRKRVENLLKLRLLPRTKFLLATSDKPNKAEAERRVRIVKEVLQGAGLSVASMVGKDIIYDYFSDVNPKQLATDDVPIDNSTESKQLLSRSVWVYRLDCL